MKNRIKGNFHRLMLIILVILVFLLCFFFGLGVVISWNLKDCDQTFRNNVVVVYSSLASSFLAFLGVMLSIVCAKLSDREKNKISCIPNFFIPNKYDLAKIVNFRIDLKSSSSKPIPNNRLCFQNTNKTDFIIENISVFKTDNVSLYEYPVNIYINRGLLFLISFYCEKIVCKIILKTNSLDGCTYLFSVDLENSIVKRIE